MSTPKPDSHVLTARVIRPEDLYASFMSYMQIGRAHV